MEYHGVIKGDTRSLDYGSNDETTRMPIMTTAPARIHLHMLSLLKMLSRMHALHLHPGSPT